MVKILRKSYETHEAQFPKFSAFVGQKSIFRLYYIENVKEGIQFQVNNINNESVSQFSQIISVKVKKNVRKSQAQFGEKLGKLRLRQNDDFLIKKISKWRGFISCNEKRLMVMMKCNQPEYVIHILDSEFPPPSSNPNPNPTVEL